MNELKIVWKKWIDPFSTEHVEGGDVDREPEEEELENSYYDMYKQEFEDIKAEAKDGYKLLMSPMGAIPITELSQSGKTFNFWTGHFNFDITPRIFQIVEKTPGIETLDIFTRYRLRIGIGVLFRPADVFSDVERRIHKYFASKTNEPR